MSREAAMTGEGMSEVEQVEQVEQEQQEQPGVEIPVDFFLTQLRNEIANLNDQRLRLQAQVDYQAAVINQLQGQIQV